LVDGDIVGLEDGGMEGLVEGVVVGETVGLADGDMEGLVVGVVLGDAEGDAVGERVGDTVGLLVGVAVVAIILYCNLPANDKSLKTRLPQGARLPLANAAISRLLSDTRGSLGDLIEATTPPVAWI